MYLVGEFERNWMDSVKVKKEITKFDLGETKQNDNFQVINLDTLEYFDSNENEWRKFKHE